MIQFLVEPFEANHNLYVVAGAALLTAIAFVLMFAGYRFYRLIATVIGGLIGAYVGVSLCGRYLPDNAVLQFFLAIVSVGLVGSLFFYVSIFMLGAVLGITVAHLLSWAWLGSQGIDTEAAFHGLLVSYAVAGITAGVMAIVFRRVFLIIITALGGASLAVTSAATVAAGLYWAWRMTPIGWGLGGVALVALSVTGCIVQWKTAAEHADVLRQGRKSKSQKSKSRDRDDAA